MNMYIEKRKRKVMQLYFGITSVYALISGSSLR